VRSVLQAARVVAAAVVLLAGVAALPWLRGEDPARTVLRARFTARGDDPAAVAALRAELGVPSDALEGAGGWLARAVRGDLGDSWRSGRPAVETVWPALQVSSSLALAALGVAVAVCAVLVAVPGVRAVGRGRPTSRGVGATAAVLAALPEVVVGSLLVLVLAVGLRLLPAVGWDTPRDVLMPALALGTPAGGLLARLVTGVVDQAVAEPWGTTWRANGVPRRAFLATVTRRVLGHLAPQLVVVTVTVLGSAVAVEQVFAIPGAGSLAVDAALTQDLPVLQACLAGFLAIGLVLGLLAAAVHRLVLGPALGQEDGPAVGLVEPPPSRTWWVAVGLLALLLVVGLPRNGTRSDLDARLAPPSWAHPWGADAVGHDLLGRLAHGTVLTVGLALVVTLAAYVVALVVGLPSRRGGIGVTDVWVTVPSTVVGIVVASTWGPGLGGACVAVLLVAWVPLAVHARDLSHSAWSAGHVQAAALAGSSDMRTLRVHVLPAVAAPLARHALVRVPATALGIAGLGFLGLGADPDAAELGAILADGLRYLERAPWVAAGPSAVLLLLGLVGGTTPVGRGPRSVRAPDRRPSRQAGRAGR